MDDARAALTERRVAGRSPLAPSAGVIVALAALPLAVLAGGFVWPLVAIGRRALGADGLGDVLGSSTTWRVVWFTRGRPRRRRC